MFFSTYVLTKKGPLAKVWLAAHWDRRLTRNEVKVVNLNRTIVHIMQPVVPIALRTTGELLVGVVRIYALKVKHLLKEATDATLFLRVTTTQKGSSVTTSGTAVSLAAGLEKATKIDGVLVSRSGEAEAVTFDWSGDAAKQTNITQAAKALGEARFDEIADLLEGASTGPMRAEGSAQKSRDDGLLTSAWYTVEPSSQVAEELRNTQQDYDEIARMRADLMTFGERAGSSTSKSKSSLTSIEKGRGSTAVDGTAAVPFPTMADELDIGVPLPDDLPPSFPTMNAQDQLYLPVDPFALPEILQSTEAAGSGEIYRRHGRKQRLINVLDLAATTLSREEIDKCMSDRSDTLDSESRRGPLDEQEERDRYTIAGKMLPTDAAVDGLTSCQLTGMPTGWLAFADTAPLSEQRNPALRASFAAALRNSMTEVMKEAARATQASGRRTEQTGRRVVPDEMTQLPPCEVDDNLAEIDAATGRKRSREEGDSVSGGFSASARHTFNLLRAAVLQGPPKRSRTEDACEIVGRTCMIRKVCANLRRRDAARVFVDTLSLASKQVVGMHQDAPSGDVVVTFLEPCVEMLGA